MLSSSRPAVLESGIPAFESSRLPPHLVLQGWAFRGGLPWKIQRPKRKHPPYCSPHRYNDAQHTARDGQLDRLPTSARLDGQISIPASLTSRLVDPPTEATGKVSSMSARWPDSNALDGPPAAPRTARIYAKSSRGSVSWFNGPSGAVSAYRESAVRRQPVRCRRPRSPGRSS